MKPVSTISTHKAYLQGSKNVFGVNIFFFTFIWILLYVHVDIPVFVFKWELSRAVA